MLNFKNSYLCILYTVKMVSHQTSGLEQRFRIRIQYKLSSAKSLPVSENAVL